MRWQNHKLTTFAMVYSATGSFAATGCALIGCVLPDALEFRGLFQHRTITHYPYIYMVSAVLTWFSLKRAPGYFEYILFFVLIGCLCHLVQDILSKGGIPLKSPWTGRWGANFYITREASEYATAGAILFAAGLIALFFGRLDSVYLTRELVNFTSFVGGLVIKLKTI